MQDRPRISNLCCNAIEKLAESTQALDQYQQSNALTPHFESIASALFTNSKRTDTDGTNVNLVQNSLTALTQVTQFACSNSNESIGKMLNAIL
jgi:hypothetical protein